jgi:hypothetical protein
LYSIWNAQARSGDVRLVVAHFPRSYQSHFFIREPEIYPEHDYFLIETIDVQGLGPRT